jgi:hypothetical protein
VIVNIPTRLEMLPIYQAGSSRRQTHAELLVFLRNRTIFPLVDRFAIAAATGECSK